MMLGQVVKVQKEKIATCMTCPLCNNLFKDATTISECLHTFCRKCIYKKITDEELDSCPVCDTELGCSPIEKLRADHRLQDLRAKIFPSKRKKAKEPEKVSTVPEDVSSVPEAVPAIQESMPVQEAERSVTFIGRRKERSLSSLVVSTPKIPVKSVLTGRRLKSIAKKQESPVSIEAKLKKADDYCESSSSPETLRKIAQTKRLVEVNSSTTDSSKQPNKDSEDGAKPCKRKADLWKPLDCLVEAASKTNSNKSKLPEILIQIKKLDAQEEEAQANKASVKEHGDKSKVNVEESNSTASPSGSVKPRRLQGMRQKRAALSEGLNIPAHTVVDSNSKCGRRFSPVWFSLVASDEQDGGAPLPQISSCYLRAKDGSLPVSYIKKYLVQKLGLLNEAEVEISMCGQPVVSTFQLHNLVEWWLQTTSASEKIQTTVGSSAKDFVMVLSYGRKAQPP